MHANPDDIRRRIASAKPALAVGAAGRFAELGEDLEDEIREVAELGAAAVPRLDFSDIVAGTVPAQVPDLVRKRGCVVIRGVFSPERAAAWNDALGRYVEDESYLARDRARRGANAGRAQMFPVYWSPAQTEARQSGEMAAARRWLNRLWDFRGDDGEPVFNPDRECVYADRIRRRRPGDNTPGLPNHVDGGSVERWLDPGFRAVYREALSGDWRMHNPFRAAGRPEAEEIRSHNVCSAFRTYQGWTALTPQGGPGGGALQLVPIARAMAWLLLRGLQDDVAEDEFCGAVAGRSLQVSPEFHAPLLRALVSIPAVEPGDTAWWHPDVVHGVEKKHGGGESNVMYVPAAPDCAKNRAYLARQLGPFLEGRSAPDFPPEDYETAHPGRATEADLTPLGRRQIGLDSWD